ncbi:DNA polymerase III subunit delta [Montanilutibacter psychrotolerans]|uniref:DNA polymerase III subunit delta n=1 Tax=Montanilutibacter psychrotolerans TaxID=1327343 RepID=A0A3M8T3T2_9GAMM|nr:DNA polymerase III subunit delta [Lysobacter psychrotolerans]RNF86346.1 DNA polymerase III subunit delta [Lysobacter psychrotolerans]
MELKPEQMAAQLDSEPLRPAYLIAGPEPLRVLEAADAVRAAARAQGIAEREIFEAEGNQREPDWNALEASFRAPSLFASRRLVELRLPTGKPGKDGAEVISGFCADPPPDVTLLVSAGEWSKQHGGKWSEAIGRIGVIAIAWQVKPHELVDWIDRRLRSRGLKAGRDAVQQLAERVDGNLLAAAQEVDKLALLSDGSPLDAQKMQSLVADAARFDVFRVMDAALNGNAAQVSRMLAGLRAEGEAVPALLGMVVKELQTTAALSRASNLANEFRTLRVWDTKQPMYRRALQRHDAPRWEAFVAHAGRVDRMAKGREAGDAWLALERLLVAVAEPRALRLLARTAV